jgi:predicted dehydrogenase
MSGIGIGVIGYGYWGPNLARNIAELSGASLVSIADAKPERRTTAARRHSGVSLVASAEELIADPRIDALVVATPVNTHFQLASKALKAGKHVLVEKPICASSEEAMRLIEMAEARNLVLMVDHTFPYTGSVRKVKELVSGGTIGDPYYYDSVRVNLGLFQKDVGVIWDLAVHDLSIMDYVFDYRPVAVSCTGMNHIAGQPEDVAYVTLFFNENFIAHLHVNWLSPVKLRRTLIGGSSKMIVYDDLEAYEKVRVHDKGLIVEANKEQTQQMLLRGYRSGDVWSPQLDIAEALGVELNHFVRCVLGEETPITDGNSGYRVVQILEAAEQSLHNNGVPVELAGSLQEA